MIGIYKITNPEGKIYIGKSINLEKRIYAYSKAYCKAQKKLYESFKKHGIDNHEFEVVEECQINDLKKRELYFQLKYKSTGQNGLNCIFSSVLSDDNIKNNSKIQISVQCHPNVIKKVREFAKKRSVEELIRLDELELSKTKNSKK